MKTIGVINGPNLDRLGKREPELYGTQSLMDLEKLIKDEAFKLGIEVLCFQSNREGDIIDKINEWAEKKIDGIVINPAAYSHTSIGIRDAISGAEITFVEVHISNIYSREPYRQFSYTSGVCEAVICGMGFEGYLMAMRFLVK